MLEAAANVLERVGLLLVTVDSSSVSWLAALSFFFEQVAHYSCVWDPRPAQQCVLPALEVIVKLPQRPDALSWAVLSWCYDNGAMLYRSKEAGIVVRGVALVPRFAVLAITVLVSTFRQGAQMQSGVISWFCLLSVGVLVMCSLFYGMLHEELFSSVSLARTMRHMAVLYEVCFVVYHLKPIPPLTMAWLVSLQLSAAATDVGILIENGCTLGGCQETFADEVWIWVDLLALCTTSFVCWKCRQKWCLIVMFAAMTAIIVLPATTANWLPEFEALMKTSGGARLLWEMDFISVSLVAFGGGLYGSLALLVAIQSAIAIQRIAHGV
jgi:hypothetical protein